MKMTGEELAKQFGELNWFDGYYSNSSHITFNLVSKQEYEVPTAKFKVPAWFDEWYHDADSDDNDLTCINILSDTDNHELEYFDIDSDRTIKHKLKDQDRIKFINAIINGYEVEKEKCFLLPLEGTGQGDSYKLYATVSSDEGWRTNGYACAGEAIQNKFLYVTQSQIDSAPAWVKAIKPVEVEADENN